MKQPNYSYQHLSYRINITENNFSIYEPFFNGLTLMDYIDKSNAETLLKNESALYHELSHYYQDLFFPACICERDLKYQILANYISSSTNIEANEKNQNLCSLYQYLFKEKYCDNSLDSLSKHDNEIDKWGGSIDFWNIGYTDLLESYADIRSSKTLLDLYFKKDKRIDAFLSDYIKKHSIFHYDIIDNHKLLTRLRRTERPYAICKHIFLTLLSATHSRFFYNDEFKSFERVKIDLASGFTFEKDVWFYQLERNLDIYLLFCIEFALTLPSASAIIKLIKEGKDRRMFHPGARFYSIIALICLYPDTFNQLNFKASYTDVFNQISGICGLFKYEDVINTLTSSDIPFYVVQYGHTKYLKETLNNVKIENRCNIDIMNFFKQIGFPILLWGDERQLILTGDGKNKFESYVYNRKNVGYIYDFLVSDYQRLSLGQIRDLNELKKTINLLLMQESAMSLLLNKCANAIISDKKKAICPMDCVNKDDGCIILTKLRSNDNLFCALSDLTKFIKYN